MCVCVFNSEEYVGVVHTALMIHGDPAEPAGNPPQVDFKQGGTNHTEQQTKTDKDRET